MRIPIRVQLGVVILLCALLPLAVLAIAVWVNNHNFVINVTSNSLALTASLKASQIASDLLLIQSTCATIVTRILLQRSLLDFYAGDITNQNWSVSTTDVQSALASGGYSSLLQTIIYSRNGTGNSGGLLNVTAAAPNIQLPSLYDNGKHAMLGDNTSLGYPTALYPNITYTSLDYPDDLDKSVNATYARAFNDFPLNATSYLLLGPLQINNSYALLSLTLPITYNKNRSLTLGYMTVIAAATSLIGVTQSREGLGNTGIVTIIGPSRRENQFKYGERPSTADYAANPEVAGEALVHYVLPPINATGEDRHSNYNRNLSNLGSSDFRLSQYPPALAGFTQQNAASPNNASSDLTTTNEQGVSVAVGYARPASTLVSWLLVVEQSHAEAWAPTNHLRNIVLACVFGTFGFVLLIVIPMAHFSVRPIRRLRDATKKSIALPGYTPEASIRSERLEENGDGDLEFAASQRSKKGIFVRLRNLGNRTRTLTEKYDDERRRNFKIPGKVPTRKHLITDELTELTDTFNEMTDELILGYTSLDAKVTERTAQLEESKKAAEAANESKTLFIANISHELKTPLNGILGMCSVMMHEQNTSNTQRGLEIVHKSGDLLLNLLNDLLLFSKNQIGQQLSLEEKEFRLNDIKTQINTLFTTQVKEGNINFTVTFLNADSETIILEGAEKALPVLGPSGVRLKDMCLWGDYNRIIQVIINLVSNALKFTPPSGTVEVRIKCLGEAESTSDGSRHSMNSNQSSQRSRNRYRNDSGSKGSQSGKKPSSPGQHVGTALLINPMDPKAIPRVQVRERSRSPPPLNAKFLWFLFEIADSGPGIPEDMQGRVFEPFVQGDLGLSKKYGGTGLGLSICSQLATLMGGSISLTSKEGSGSTFALKIPLRHTKTRAPSTSSSEVHGSRAASISDEGPSGLKNQVPLDASPRNAMDNDKQPRLVGLSQPFFAVPPSPPTPETTQNQLEALDHAAAAKEPGSKVRVLVAEDNLVNQEVVVRMLSLEGKFDVVVAKDGQEAYDKVKEEMAHGRYFDLIFMDIQMPNLDGLQSTRLIRQMGYSAPIVALTAFAEDSNVKECLASGMDFFLSKPIRRPQLKKVLKQFATIPEEPETRSLATTNKASSPAASDGEADGMETTSLPDDLIVPTTNGHVLR